MKIKLLNFSKNLIIALGLVVIVMMLFFTTSSYAASQTVGQLMRSTVSSWFIFIQKVCIGAYGIVFLLICLKLFLYRKSDDVAVIKESLAHFIIMFIVLYFLHYIMISVILLNQKGVNIAKSLGNSLSGIDTKIDEYDLYETALSKAYEISSVPGFVGLIMYLLLVFYTYLFVFVYFRRYINIVVLMLLGPIIISISSTKKILTGVNNGQIKKWFKEFIFNVIIQTLHALFYATFIGFALSFSDTDENLIGVLLALIVFGFIFKIDGFIRKIFNAVGGSTSIKASRAASNIIDGAGKTIGFVNKGLSVLDKGASGLNSDSDSKVNGFGVDIGESTESETQNIQSKFKQLPNVVGEKMFILKDNAKQKIDSKVSDLKRVGENVKNDFNDLDNILNGERVKANLTKDEIISEYHNMQEAKGLEGLRQKVQAVGIETVGKFKKFGKYSSNKVKSIYYSSEVFVKNKILKIQQEYNYMVKDIENNFEIVKRLPKILKKNKKKQEYIKNSNGLNMDVSNAMMLVVDSNINLEEFLNELKKEFDDNVDVSAFVFDKLGAQAFLSSDVGAPIMGMVVLAEDNYEKIAEHKMDDLLTGQKRTKKKLKKPVNKSEKSNSSQSKKLVKTIKNSENVNKVYKFSRFDSKTVKKITKKMLKKSKAQNRYLIVLSKTYEDMQIKKFKPIGRIKSKVVDINYKMVANRKEFIKSVRKMKLEQSFAVATYKEIYRKTKRIELANYVASKAIMAKNKIKLGFKQIDNMTPGQIVLRKMIKSGNAYQLPNNLVMMKKDIFAQEKIKATGIFQPKSNTVLQFVITESGELIPQLVTIDGKIIKYAIDGKSENNFSNSKLINKKLKNLDVTINGVKVKRKENVITRIRNMLIYNKIENLDKENANKEIISNLLIKFKEVISQNIIVDTKKTDISNLLNNIKEIITQSIPAEEKEVDTEKLIEKLEEVITQAIPAEEKEVNTGKLIEKIKQVITKSIPAEEKEVDTEKLIENIEEVITQSIPAEEKEVDTEKLIENVEEVITQSIPTEEKEVDTEKLIEKLEEVIAQTIPVEKKEVNTEKLIEKLEEVVTQSIPAEEKEVDTEKLIENIGEVVTTQTKLKEPKELNSQNLMKQLEQAITQTIQKNNVNVVESNVSENAVLKQTKEVNFNENSDNVIVQHIVNLEGNIIQQIVRNDNTIETNNYEILQNNGNQLVQQIGEIVSNNDLGLPIDAPVEDRVKKFEDLLKDINTHTLLEQVLEDSTQKEEERELDEIIAISALQAEKTSLKHLDYNTDEDAKNFAIENMVSKGIFTSEDIENNDIVGNALDVLNNRVQYLSSNNSDLLIDKAAEIEYVNWVNEEISDNNENFIINEKPNVNIETKVKDFSELLTNLARERVQEITEFPAEVIKNTAQYTKEVITDSIVTPEQKAETEAEKMFKKELEKAEKKWAKRNNKKKEKNIYTKVKNQGKNSEEDEQIKITLKFFGAVRNQGQSIVLSNRNSIKDFYDKVDKLENADLNKTQKRFLKEYGDKLKELQLMPFTFAKCPVLDMDEWSIYVVSESENIDEYENYQKNKESDEIEEDVLELIDKYFSSLKEIFKKFMEENEITSFDNLHQSIEDLKEFTRKIRTLLFRRGEVDSQIKATKIVNNLHKDIRFKNIMKDVNIDIMTKKLAKEKVKKAEEKMELKTEKEAEEIAKENTSEEDIDEDKKQQKEDFAQQILEEITKEEQKEATTNQDLQDLLNQLNDNKLYIQIDEKEKKNSMKFQY